MNKKDLYAVVGISCFVSIFFLITLNNCFITPLDSFIASMGGIGLFVVPVLLGIYFYKKEVGIDV